MDTPDDEFSKPSALKYAHRFLQFADSLLSEYSGPEPFHLYLQKYFSANKKHGSKDRRYITSLCYNYLRLGCGVSPNTTLQDKLLLGIFLFETKSSAVLNEIKPEWNEKIELDLKDKIKVSENIFDLKKVFPFNSHISDKIDYEEFGLSFLKQPKLFVRLRPGKESIVLDKLKAASISFQEIQTHCLVFSHNEKLSSIIKIDKEGVIQDYNSQRIGGFFQKDNLTENAKQDRSSITVWDCCAGSGGKSILAFDILGNIKLTVTDKRESILQNLHRRFTTAGIKNYSSYKMNLADKNQHSITSNFDLIIADVPCSGSGTWARTPEHLTFFKEEEIEKYTMLQKKIFENIVPHLRHDGILLYITCSVFKEENENNVEFFLQKFNLTLINTEYLTGYEMGADTLFVAVFRNDER